jgi:hypothetical protein
MAEQRGTDRAGRRSKRLLTPLQKYEIWLQLVRQELRLGASRNVSASAAEARHDRAEAVPDDWCGPLQRRPVRRPPRPVPLPARRIPVRARVVASA